MAKSVLFVGLVNDSNLGDPLIVKIVKSIYSDFLFGGKGTYDIFDLKSFSTTNDSSIKFSVDINDLFVGDISKRRTQQERIEYQSSAILDFINNYDVIIITGGGIISYKFYYLEHICAIIDACEKLNKKIIINSVGIEDYSRNDSEFKFWKRYLNSNCIKYFSTRDYIDELRNDWICNENIITEFVPDNVILLDRYTNIKRNIESDIIGVGLIRQSVYDDFYGLSFSEKLVEFYTDVAKVLEKSGVKYEFFTNGVPSDLYILKEVEKHLGHVCKVSIPYSTDSLIGIISGYRGLITARMHSMIIAYSLGIPFISLNWHKKVKFFNELIDNDDYLFDIVSISGNEVLSLLKKRLRKKENEFLKELLSNKIIKSINNVAKLIEQ